MKEKNKTKKKLTLFALTWPIFIEILLHMLMGNADTLMLSQYSDNSVAAVGVSNQIISIIIVMFGFVAAGTAVLIAQHVGAREHDRAADISVISIVVNLAFGLLLSIVIALSSKHMLNFMDLPSELMDEANTYLVIIGGFSFIQALIMTIGSILRSNGFTKDTMYVTIAINILNVIGNYLFIFGPFGIPVLGVMGVAISTVVSRFIGLIILSYIMFKKVEHGVPFKRLSKIPSIHLKNLLKIGVPSAGEHLAYNTSQMLITYFITILGTQALTTKVYTQNIMMFIFLFSVAISQGTQILIGHMVGARDFDSAYKRCLRSLYVAIGISTVMGVIVWFFAEPLLGIFTDNQEIIETGKTLFLLTILLEPGRAFNLVIINSLRAAGDVKLPVYMGIFSMWGIGVPVAYFLGVHLGFGLAGIWVSFILDEWIRGIVMLWRWRTRAWEKKVFITDSKEQAV